MVDRLESLRNLSRENRNPTLEPDLLAGIPHVLAAAEKDLAKAPPEIWQSQVETQELRFKQDLVLYCRSLLSPIRRLPWDIIVEIFLHAACGTGTKEGFRLGSVCYMWRCVALSTPQIWCILHAHLSEGGGSEPELMNLALTRSGNQALSVNVIITGNYCPSHANIWKALAAHSCRWRHLRLSFVRQFDERRPYDFTPALQGCVPKSLESLHVDDPAPPFLLPISFLQALRKLHSMSLARTDRRQFTAALLPLRQLTTLELQRVHISMVYYIFERCPKLVSLSLDRVDGAGSGWHPRQWHSCLSTLSILSSPAQTTKELLCSAGEAPKLTSLTIEVYSIFSIIDFSEFICRSGCKPEHIKLVIVGSAPEEHILGILQFLPFIVKLEVHFPFVPLTGRALMRTLIRQSSFLPRLCKLSMLIGRKPWGREEFETLAQLLRSRACPSSPLEGDSQNRIATSLKAICVRMPPGGMNESFLSLVATSSAIVTILKTDDVL